MYVVRLLVLNFVEIYNFRDAFEDDIDILLYHLNMYSIVLDILVSNDYVIPDLLFVHRFG